MGHRDLPRRLQVKRALFETRLVVCASSQVDFAGSASAFWRAGGQLVAVRHLGEGTFEGFRAARAEISDAGRPWLGALVDRGVDVVGRYIESGADFVFAPDDDETAALCAAARVLYVPLVREVEDLDSVLRRSDDAVVVDSGWARSDSELRPLLASNSSTAVWVRMAADVSQEWLDELVAMGAHGIVACDAAPAGSDSELDALPVTTRTRRAFGEPLFGAVEHVGLYAAAGATDEAVTLWYQEVFGYPAARAKTVYLGTGILGRIEVMPGPIGEHPHIAVSVRDFDEAIEALEKAGHAVGPVMVTANAKLTYLDERDPAGCLVHIIWRPRGFAE